MCFSRIPCSLSSETYFEPPDAPAVSAAGGPARPVEEDRRLGKALTDAVGITPQPVPFPAGNSEDDRADVRSLTYDLLLDACSENPTIEEQWAIFVDFVKAIRHVVIDRPSGVVACSWSVFVASDSVMPRTGPHAQHQSSLERTLAVFRRARWAQPSTTVAAGGAQLRCPVPATARVRPTPLTPVVMPVVIEESDDEEEGRARAEVGDAVGRGILAPLGELPASFVKPYGVFVTKMRQNVELAPRPAEHGGNSWNAAQSSRDIAELARDTISGAYSANLDDVYGSYESIRFSPSATLPRETHDANFRSAFSGRDVILNCHSSLGTNALRRLAVTLGLKIGIGSEGGLIFPDVRQISDLPTMAYALRAWLLEKVESLIGVLVQICVRERPEMTPAPSAEDVVPDISLVPIIANAIAATVCAAAAKWRNAPVRFLAYFLLCEWIFRGRVHLRVHTALERVLAELLVAVSAAGSSSERWPNYIDYSSSRAAFVPLSWGTPLGSQRALVGASGVSVAAAPVSLPSQAVLTLSRAIRAPFQHGKRGRSQSSSTVTAARPPMTVPWAVSNPDAPRTHDCPYCGPGHAHSLWSCESYTAYKTSGGQPLLPNLKSFPVGKSYNQVRTAQRMLFSPRTEPPAPQSN